jgi:DNA repair exonuclease SbcCD nuclease subunit
MSVRFLHLADCHLGAAHGDFPDRAHARREEVKSTFRAALERVLDPVHAIDGVLVAGDLFDSRRPDSDTLALVRGLFARLVANGKAVVVLPGFHDSIAYPDSVFRSERFPGVDVLAAAGPGAPLVRQIGGCQVHLYGAAHVPGRTPDVFPGFARAGSEGLHVGLLHGMVPGHAEESTRPAPWRIPAAVLEQSGLDYVALGHCHQHTEYRFDRGRVAAYCGALEGVRFAPGDLGRKSLAIVTLEPGSVTVESVPFSRKTLVDETIDLDAETIRDAESLRAALIARAGADVVARFVLTGTREFNWDREAFIADIEGRFAALRLVDRSTFENSSLLRRIATENTIRGFFVRRMRDRIDRLREQAASPYADRDIDRQIAVSERALTIGLEQFLEDDAVPAASPAPERRGPAPQVAPPAVSVVALENGTAAGIRAATAGSEVVIEEGA